MILNTHGILLGGASLRVITMLYSTDMLRGTYVGRICDWMMENGVKQMGWAGIVQTSVGSLESTRGRKVEAERARKGV